MPADAGSTSAIQSLSLRDTNGRLHTILFATPDGTTYENIKSINGSVKSHITDATGASLFTDANPGVVNLKTGQIANIGNLADAKVTDPALDASVISSLKGVNQNVIDMKVDLRNKLDSIFGATNDALINADTAGTLHSKVRRLTKDMSDILTKITSVDTKIATQTTLASVLSELTAIKGYVDGIEGLIDGLEGFTDQLEGYVDGLESNTATINTTLGTTNTTLGTTNGKLDSLIDLVDNLEGFTDGIESKLDAINESVSNSTATNQKLDTIDQTLQDQLDAVNAKLAGKLTVSNDKVNQQPINAVVISSGGQQIGTVTNANLFGRFSISFETTGLVYATIQMKNYSGGSWLTMWYGQFETMAHVQLDEVCAEMRIIIKNISDANVTASCFISMDDK